MKKIIMILASAICMFSCSQNDEIVTQSKESVETVTRLSSGEAQQNFAKILSKAVYNSAEVRSFLKEHALAQFDNDYDIFYPFVKNRVVSNEQTFREVLLSYCENENELIQIEESLLLLNILVPDLSWISDFNAETWDIKDPEVAVICKDDDTNTLFGNGEAMDNLPSNEIPGFPCLVIKNNERVKLSKAVTRSGDVTYEFISDVFNPEKNRPQTRNKYEDPLEITEIQSPFATAVQLDSTIINAWKECKDVPNAYDRDYIYYGISKTNPSGPLNRNMRESLFKFRINPNLFTTIADQAEKDPSLGQTSKESGKLTTEEIVQNVWKDGRFEFYFTCYVGNRESDSPQRQQLVFNLAPREVFSIEKVNVDYVNRTLFRHSKYTYTVDPKNLRARWIYPANLENIEMNDVFTKPWDLQNQSLSIHMTIEERDDSQQIAKTETFTDTYTSKTDFETGTSDKEGDTTSTIKNTSGFSSTTTHTSTTTTTTTLTSDNLGTLTFYFYDPIIVEVGPMEYLYGLYSVSNGAVEAVLMPQKLR